MPNFPTIWKGALSDRELAPEEAASSCARMGVALLPLPPTSPFTWKGEGSLDPSMLPSSALPAQPVTPGLESNIQVLCQLNPNPPPDLDS